MKISKNCVNFVKRFEGFKAYTYYDMVGVRTLGYGMTGKEISGLSYVTEHQASNMLETLLNYKYALPISLNLAIKHVALNQNEFDAIVSMAYNVGVGGLLGSTLYYNITHNIKNKATITSNFQSWSNAGGRRVEGLFRRRTEEAKMFFTPIKPTVKSIFPRNGTVTANKLNVRVDAGTGFKIVDTVDKNNIVRVTKAIGPNWYAILRFGTTRYVSSRYIKLD